MSNFAQSQVTASELVQRVWSIRKQLDDALIWNEVRMFRLDGVTILAHVPGAYWEIDVLEDGSVDFEVFKSVGDLQPGNDLQAAIAEMRSYETQDQE
jgi:hypothetical protein